MFRVFEENKRKNLIIGQPIFGTVSSKTPTRSWGNSLGEGEHFAGSKTQESVDENCEYSIALLKLNRAVKL
jgi:hypothetical protein